MRLAGVIFCLLGIVLNCLVAMPLAGASAMCRVTAGVGGASVDDCCWGVVGGGLGGGAGETVAEPQQDGSSDLGGGCVSCSYCKVVAAGSVWSGGVGSVAGEMPVVGELVGRGDVGVSVGTVPAVPPPKV